MQPKKKHLNQNGQTSVQTDETLPTPKRINNKRQTPERTDFQKFYELVILWFIISFLGWCAETLHFIIRWHDLIDRGFLTLPVCPIYGFSLIAIYLVIGTPAGGRLAPIFRKAREMRPVLRTLSYIGLYFLYFLIAAILPSAVEFATGAFFDKIVGVSLWDYSYKKFHLLGYVSLGQTILWGFMITLAMTFLWDRLRSLIQKIPPLATKRTAIVLIAVISADFAFNIIYLCVCTTHLMLY